MKAALDVILHGSLVQMEPFALNGDDVASFEFIYTADDREYQYGFTANRERIYEEYLKVYKTERPSEIYMK